MGALDSIGYFTINALCLRATIKSVALLLRELPTKQGIPCDTLYCCIALDFLSVKTAMTV